jgi:integrase-like protein
MRACIVPAVQFGVTPPPGCSTRHARTSLRVRVVERYACTALSPALPHQMHFSWRARSPLWTGQLRVRRWRGRTHRPLGRRRQATPKDVAKRDLDYFKYPRALHRGDGCTPVPRSGALAHPMNSGSAGRSPAKEQDFVFSTEVGTPFYYRNVSVRGLDKAADRAGLNAGGKPRLSMHDLRHTFASHLILDLKLDVAQVSRQLGHFRPSITLDASRTCRPCTPWGRHSPADGGQRLRRSGRTASSGPHEVASSAGPDTNLTKLRLAL